MFLIFKVIYKYTLLNIQITNYIAALKMGWFGKLYHNVLWNVRIVESSST